MRGVPVLRLQNIGKGYFINKNIKYITKEKAEELKYHSFVPGDIVLAKLGIPIGKTCIVPSDFEEGIITADIVRIRLNNKLMDYNFLEYILNTDIAVSQLTRGISGATRPRVNLSNVREIEITFPKSIAEQKELVIKIDKLKEKVDEGSAILLRKIAALDELKKSLLQKAFNGEL
jgi:type I restriction enzyme S subunit